MLFNWLRLSDSVPSRRRENSSYQMLPPAPPPPPTASLYKIPSSFYCFESGSSCSSAISTSMYYKLKINIWKWVAFHIYQLISSFGWALVELHPFLFCLSRDVFNYLCSRHIRPKAISPCKVQWGTLWYLLNIHNPGQTSPESPIDHPV